MCKKIAGALLITASLLTAGTAHPASVAAVAVQPTLEEVAVLELAGTSPGLTISNAGTQAGALPPAANDSSASLRWSCNVASGRTRRLTAQLSADYPAGMRLSVTLAKPAGSHGSSAGTVALSTSAQDIFSGISGEACAGATITRELSITHLAGTLSGDTRTIVWTLTDDQ